MITAVVLGGVNIFGGSGTLVGVVIALFVLAFVKNALGLVGMTPEQPDIVTGAVLVGTLIIFGVSHNAVKGAAGFRGCASTGHRGKAIMAIRDPVQASKNYIGISVNLSVT